MDQNQDVITFLIQITALSARLFITAVAAHYFIRKFFQNVEKQTTGNGNQAAVVIGIALFITVCFIVVVALITAR